MEGDVPVLRRLPPRVPFSSRTPHHQPAFCQPIRFLKTIFPQSLFREPNPRAFLNDDFLNTFDTHPQRHHPHHNNQPHHRAQLECSRPCLVVVPQHQKSEQDWRWWRTIHLTGPGDPAGMASTSCELNELHPQLAAPLCRGRTVLPIVAAFPRSRLTRAVAPSRSEHYINPVGPAC
jgi:hypothetical protein